MIQGITERYIGLSSGHIDCEIHHNADETSSPENLMELSGAIAGLKNVKNAFPMIQGIGLAAGKKSRTGATIRAVQYDMFSANEAYKKLFEVTDGTTEFNGKKSAVVGAKFAEILGLKAGSTFRLITTKTIEAGKTVPKITPFKVSGIVSCGYQELDALWVFIPLETAYDILPVNSSKISISAETTNPFGIELSMAEAQIELEFPVFTSVTKWNEIRENKAIFDNFESTQIMLLLIMILIILVASVNISSALVMLVMERRKEIAILKSIGGKSSDITVSFLITGMVTGGLGVLAGVPVGLFCAVNMDSIIAFIEKIANFFAKVYFVLIDGKTVEFTQIRLLSPEFYLQKIPLTIPLGQLLIICGGTLVLSLLVSAIPAIKAGKEKPLEIMRKN